MRKHFLNLRERVNSPVIVPRYLFTLKYIGFIGLGAIAVVFGLPSLNATTWDGYENTWGAALTLLSIGAAVASLDKTRENIERWLALLVTALLAVYACSAIYLSFTTDEIADRAGFAWVVCIVTMLPAIRAFSLLSPQFRAVVAFLLKGRRK